MKLLVYYTEILIISISFMVVCSCGGNNHKEKDLYVGNKVEEENIPDSMVRVVLNDFTKDSLYVTVQSTMKKYSLGYFKALNEQHIKGSLVKGNLYTMQADGKTHEIKYIVNLTELCGKWFYTEGGHQRGMLFELEGALSPINPEEVSFRRWMIRNGNFLIFYVYLQQEANVQREFEVDDTEIATLTPDELTFKFRGKTLQCKHIQQPIKFRTHN